MYAVGLNIISKGTNGQKRCCLKTCFSPEGSCKYKKRLPNSGEKHIFIKILPPLGSGQHLYSKNGPEGGPQGGVLHYDPLCPPPWAIFGIKMLPRPERLRYFYKNVLPTRVWELFSWHPREMRGHGDAEDAEDAEGLHINSRALANADRCLT